MSIFNRKDLDIAPANPPRPSTFRSQTDTDGEKRHYILRPSRKSESKLMLNARHKKPASGSAAASIVIVLHNPVFGVHIGTTVINTVQRDAESQLIVEVVHRGKVESRHGVTARRSYLLSRFLRTHLSVSTSRTTQGRN